MARRTTIWIVVADGIPYIRSVRGERGRWYQDVRLEPHGAIHVGDQRIAVRAEPATDPGSVEATSRALGKKYRDDRASTIAMLQPDTLPTTLRLLPD